MSNATFSGASPSRSLASVTTTHLPITHPTTRSPIVQPSVSSFFSSDIPFSATAPVKVATPLSSDPTNSPTASSGSGASSGAAVSDNKIIIISVCVAAFILFAGGALSFFLCRRKRNHKNGSFFALPCSSKQEKFPISRKSSTSSFYTRRQISPQYGDYHDMAHSPLLQQVWKPSFEAASQTQSYVVRDADSQVYDPNRASSPEHLTTLLQPSHSRTISQSTTLSYASDDTIVPSAPQNPNPSPYRQYIQLPPLTIPSHPVLATLQNASTLPRPPPPPPLSPPPPQPPSRKPSSRRTYDTDDTASVYSQSSISYPETPVPQTAKSHATQFTTTSQAYQSTIQLPSAIDFNHRSPNAYTFPSNPARASSVFTFNPHPQFTDVSCIPRFAVPAMNMNSTRIPDADSEEGIRKPGETLYSPIKPVVIRYDQSDKSGPSNGESLIIGKLLKSRAKYRDVKGAGDATRSRSDGTSSVLVSRNSSVVSHIERQGSIKGVSSPVMSEHHGDRRRGLASLGRKPSRLSRTVEGYYHGDEEEALPSDYLRNPHPFDAAVDIPSPTGATEGNGMFSPLSPPSASLDAVVLKPFPGSYYGH